MLRIVGVRLLLVEKMITNIETKKAQKNPDVLA
jgi:hypothetical protein